MIIAFVIFICSLSITVASWRLEYCSRDKCTVTIPYLDVYSAQNRSSVV